MDYETFKDHLHFNSQPIKGWKVTERLGIVFARKKGAKMGCKFCNKWNAYRHLRKVGLL